MSAMSSVVSVIHPSYMFDFGNQPSSMCVEYQGQVQVVRSQLAAAAVDGRRE